MKDLVALVPLLPDDAWSGLSTVVSGVLGAAIAVLVMLFSNRNARAMLREQLGHDSSEKSKERKIAARRQIYLEVSEELVRASSFLVKLQRINPAEFDIGDGLTGLNAALSKAQLLCEFKNIKAISRLGVEYAVALFSIVKIVQPMHNSTISLSIVSANRDKYEVERDRIVGARKALDESGRPRDAEYFALVRSQAENDKLLADAINQRIALLDRRVKINRELATPVLAEMKRLADITVDVLVALREELESDSDPDAYRAILMENIDRVETEMNRLLAGLEEE